MDKLTWMALAAHQPRRATRFGEPHNDHECAACCVAVNHAMEGHSEGAVWEMTHKVEEPQGKSVCVGCGLPMEYYDAP